MSHDSETRPCYFRWKINPPFVPGHTMQARFYHESPSVTEWQVKLHFGERRIGESGIALSLMFDTWGDERKEIVAKSVEASIYLDGSPIERRETHNYSFNARNRHKYLLETSVLMLTQIKPYQIVVEISICLEEDEVEESARRLLERNFGDFSFLSDLKCLSRDLSTLAIVPLHSNVELHSRDAKVFRAHSFILMVRWRNFFRRHRFHTSANTVVRTKISSSLLGDVLMYMYSGMLPRDFPESACPVYMAELFQVIDWYGIHHLYKLFVDRTFFQMRRSRKPALSQSLDFRLHFVNDGPVENASISLHPQEYYATPAVHFNKEEFMLQIQVSNVNGAGPWLSYSLLSKSNSWVYAQVVLEVTKMGLGTEYQRVIDRRIIAHARSYSIDPNKSVESGPAVFLGCLATFGDLPSTTPCDKIEQWLRFSISFTDGTTLDEVQSHNMFSHGHLARLDVLSNHMYELLSQETHADMRLVSLSPCGNVQAVRWVHRAILKMRVPRLNGLLVGFQPERLLPTTARVHLSEEILPYVVDYIYTGKVINVPGNLLDQISYFAIRINLPTLQNLITVLRNNWV